MRGRLQGVFIVVVAGGPRLGDLVLGTEADWWNEAVAAVVGGLTCVVLLWVACLLAPAVPRVRLAPPRALTSGRPPLITS